MLVAGVSGFKPDVEVTNPSAQLLRTWIEEGHFTWLISADIIAEYKAVLARLHVRPQLLRELSICCAKKQRRSMYRPFRRCPLIQETTPSALAQSTVEPTLLPL